MDWVAFLLRKNTIRIDDDGGKKIWMSKQNAKQYRYFYYTTCQLIGEKKREEIDQKNCDPFIIIFI